MTTLETSAPGHELTSIERFVLARLSELPAGGPTGRFRALVDLVDQHSPFLGKRPCCNQCGSEWPCLTVYLIAAMWHDHPDYRRWPPYSGDLS